MSDLPATSSTRATLDAAITDAQERAALLRRRDEIVGG